MYETEVGKHDVGIVIERTIESQNVQDPASGFLRQAVQIAWDYHERVDGIISELAVGWKIERIARVDLAILRLAIVELLVGIEEPRPADAVVINEAVVLAKKFSTEDSGKFVNGILASVMKGKEKYRERLGLKPEAQEDKSGGE